jgi:NADPH2:quinone reductase
MALTVLAPAFGGPDVLTLTDVPVDAPGPGEVVLDVRAAGVNPIDWKLYSGAMGKNEATLPRRVGFEAAGVVSAVGPDATGPAGPIAVGDEVIAWQITGAYAAQRVVPASAVVPKPAAMSFEAAGGLMLTGGTAAHLLAATSVQAGDVVLVHGASGGVGQMVLQLLRAKGARAIGTAGPKRHARVKELGGEPVAYGDGLLERVRELAPDGVDAALDCVGTDEAVDVSLALVADRDRIATIAAFGRAGEAGIKLLGGGGGDPGTEVRNAARLELTALVEAGKLEVEVEAAPLADVAAVHRRAMAGAGVGKIVLVP